MSQRRVPTKKEVLGYLRGRNNWGRWGDKGSAGAMNLITPEKRLAAVRLVKTGRTVSLSRPFPVTPSMENMRPADHYMLKVETPFSGAEAMDYLAIFYHGFSATHVDALCHVWIGDQMWDGRDPDEVITPSGARYGSVDAWSDGILTRGVLLDVPKHRGKPYVTLEEPVHGWELEDIAKEEGLKLEPGDALLVYCGREAYARDHDGVWGGRAQRPGLHASCLPFIRDNDASILGFDMMDANPNEYDLPWTTHGVIHAYGVALIDNALLEPLAQVCAEEGRYEFMLTINPLVIIGGTGSPANPIAVF